MSEENKHGGYRPGSGRKTKYEKTIVMRIPEKYKDVIQRLISHLDETASLDRNFGESESEPMYLRSLMDKKQHITFITKPFK
jgi:hypothetical protein